MNQLTTQTTPTQNQRILAHLRKTKSISQREALIDYSIQCLTKRIQELRDNGHDITTEFKLHPITGQRYSRYVLNTVKKGKSK